MLWIYALIFIALAFALWAAYRVLGTPSRLAPTDYDVVVKDVASSVERAAQRLRGAINPLPNPPHMGEGEVTQESEAVVQVAASARKIFQTGYYQTLRLRPSTGPDTLGPVRAELGKACEAYDWASRMIGSESRRNPLIKEAALRLLDSGDASFKRALSQLPTSADRESSSLSR